MYKFVYRYGDHQPVHLCHSLHDNVGGRPSMLLKFQGGTTTCYEGSRAGHMGEMANNRQ